MTGSLSSQNVRSVWIYTSPPTIAPTFCIYPHSLYRDFTNVSCFTVSGTCLLHSAVISRTSTINIRIVLFLKSSTNLQAKLNAELLRKRAPAALATSSIPIVISSRMRYGSPHSAFAVLSFPVSTSHQSSLSRILAPPHSFSVTFKVFIVRVCFLCELLLNTWFMCPLKRSSRLMSKSGSVPNFGMSSKML